MLEHCPSFPLSRRRLPKGAKDIYAHLRKRLSLVALVVVGLALLMVIELRPWVDLPGASTDGPAAAGRGEKGPVAADTMPGAKSVAPLASRPEGVFESQPIRAQLSPVTYTTITGELNARIQSIPRREGETFDRGEPLIVYDCSSQRAQLDKSRAQMTISRRNYETNQRLLVLGSVSRVEHDNSRSEFEKSEAEVAELTAVISRCQTLAPFPGRVVEQKVRSQQFVQSGQPLLDILDDRAMELEFIAPSRWAPWLRVGYGFQVRVDETNKTYPARVSRVAARIDSVSQTFKVVGVIQGSYRELSAGMSGTLLIDPPKSYQGG